MDLSLTLAQTDPMTGDVRGNADLIAEVYEAEREAADLVVFPELALTGYCVLDLVEVDAFVERNLTALDRLASATGETAAIVGFVDREGDDRYNAAAVLQGGEVRGVARKSLLPNYRYFDDERYFEAAESIAPIPIRVGDDRIELGVAVCEDMWDADYDLKPIPELAAQGAELIVDISASPFEVAKRLDRDRTIRRHVEDTGLPFAYLNAAGAADVGRNVVVFDGDSLVYDAEGRLVARGAQFAEDRVAVDVGGDSDHSLEVPPGDVEAERREKELFEALAFGLRGYVRKSGFESVIEPISGGIDSALGLAICAEALGPENVVAYNFPSRVNSETTRDLAAATAENFGVEYRVVPVQSVYESVLDAYESNVGPVADDTAKENVYARVRAVLSMLASNDSPDDAPALVVSNGNETEMALGYVTLYGDMTGAVDLLGDLSKPDVYDVAAYANERHGEELIPEKTFEISPTAELRPGQVDPFDYPVVSPIVELLFEERRGPSEIVARFEARDLDPERFGTDERGRDLYERFGRAEFGDLVYDTYRRMRNSTFKRVQAPPVVAVSERAFGTDFREPILNGWDGR